MVLGDICFSFLLSSFFMRNANILKTDITDPQRHFEMVAPARALHEPVLRAAILAFSSRHINRQKQDATQSL